MPQWKEEETPGPFKTLVELLRLRAEQQPSALAYRFLEEGDASGPTTELSYAALERRVRAIGVLLTEAGAKGERALLLYPPGLDFIAAFFGCLFGSAIAVPAYPPDPSRLARTLPRLRAIARDCSARFVLTTGPILSLAEALFHEAPELSRLRWLATDAPMEADAERWRAPALSGDSIAFLQYTSGSSGAPKGVSVTHQNILHNEEMVRRAFGHDASSNVLGWLPLYHDMGLIGNVLQPLYLGGRCTLLSPVDFLRSPLRWLYAISHFQATTSGGPNFSYDLCARKATQEDIARLNLSSWTVAYNGAEPIRKETLDHFSRVFAPCGFRREAFYPCYGLAEATLFVSGGAKEEPPKVLTVHAAALEQHQISTAEPGEAGARVLVSCGQPWLEQEVQIVDPETSLPLPRERVGEIWLRGQSVARGYWARPEESREAFLAYLATGEGPFLRTGDLGFLGEGGLYITGRQKDLIIIRGRNHYPQDIELSVERCHPGIRPGCVAAFALEHDGEEQLVIVAEVDPRRGAVEPEEIFASLRREIAEGHEVSLSAALLLEPGSIPKTSSGKLQRRACRADFLNGALRALYRWGTTRASAPPLPTPDAKPALARLGASPISEQPKILEAFLRQEVSLLLRLEPEQLESGTPLSSLGMDSLLGLELKNRVEAAMGIRLDPALPWKYPTIAEISEHLLDMHLRELLAGAQKHAPTGSLSTAAREEIEL
jgi:acyl-CoA synthetase (AMP-forming)/AMP-acid ligase II